MLFRSASLLHEGYTIVAVEQVEESTPLTHFHPVAGSSLAIVFGNEVNGVGEEVLAHASECIEIPQYGTKHSINVSVAVGIVIWDLLIKMNLSAL